MSASDPAALASSVPALEVGRYGRGVLLACLGALFWSLSGVLIRLTEAGWELQKQIGRDHVRDIATLVGPALSTAEQQELLRLTEKLRASVTAR